MILFIVALIIVAGLVFVGYRNGSSNVQNPPATGDQAAALGTLSSGNPLIVQDKEVGTGTEAKVGDTITVHYTGTLMDGTKFDSSLDRNEAFTFTLGAGQVIPGWDQGLVGMKEGGVRTLFIAPELAYGSQAVGPIPANSALSFEVQLLKVGGTSTEIGAPVATSTEQE